MTNRYNRVIYWLWAPVYDFVVGRFFHKGRARAMEVVALRPAERVCLIGVGTGTDLVLLPQGLHAVGVDLSEAMLARARGKPLRSGCTVDLRIGDAQELPLESGAFDAVILNLILSVVPEPRSCLAEAIRVLRPGGRIVVFDKFLGDEAKPTVGRTLANVFSTLLGTDITRRFADIIENQRCEVLLNEPSVLGGLFRVVLLRPV